VADVIDLLILLFGGRRAREAYRAHTEAIREAAAAQRALNDAKRETRNAGA
jgi:Sec-independent protein translocase protein TatA